MQMFLGENVCMGSLLRSRFWARHATLRDEPKNGCEGDYCMGGYRKIPKRSPVAYIFQRPFLRGLSTEGNLRFKIDRASLIVRSKFSVFALFFPQIIYMKIEFSSQKREMLLFLTTNTAAVT